MKKSIIKYCQAIIALIMITFCGAGAKASTPWTVNPSDYRYDMSLYLDVAFASAPFDYSLYDVGAFVGSECRGVAEVLDLGNGKSCLYMRVRSNTENGETVKFKYYNRQTQEVADIEQTSVLFKSNGRYGYPSAPFEITIYRYYDVTFSAGQGGTVSEEGGHLEEGTQLSITATPAEGHSFVQWSDGVTDNPRQFTINEDLTLNAEFKVNKYKLNYVLDDEPFKTVEVEYGSQVSPLTVDEREGYTFSGWDGLPETMPAHDVTATGRFNINTYTATFKIGEEYSKEVQVVFGQPITAPEAPEKEGHTFAGWQDVPETMPARDLVINGSYTVNKYKLNYVLDNEPFKTIEVEYGSQVTPLTVDEREGYTFSGWDGLPETMPAHDVTATGSFSINSYKAVFKIGEEVIDTKVFEYGQPVTSPEAPEKEGHTFAGWQDVPETMPARDLVINGSYTVNKYKLNYVLDDEPFKTVEVEYGSQVSPLTVDEREGYTFSGWEGLPETMPAHDVTATGSFSINSYKAVFKIGEEVIDTKVFEYGQPVNSPEAPEKEGHTFAGWQDVPETMPARDLVINGSYTVNKYKLNYVLDDEPFKTVEVEYGSQVSPLTVDEREGYTFSGWDGLPETMPAHDVTATGSFSINSYKAVFKIGEEVIDTKVFEYGQPVTSPEAPEKEGHTFAGWQDVPETMPAHDIEILGSYTVNKYKLTYIVDDEVYKEVTLEYGTAIVPEEPAKEGYTFSGWEGLPETMPAHDVTATGSFSINSYKAVFKIGEEVIDTKVFEYGQPVNSPEAPEKEGHTFAGWQDVPETMPAHDIEILGSYTVNKYKLTYIVDDKVYKEVTLEYGTAIVPEEPAKEGYTFSGWEGLPETMPAHDVTATGSFVVNKYKLTLYLNDEVYSSEEIEFGAKLNIEDPKVPEGKQFDGWTDEIPETMPAHDLDIHGTYSDVSSIASILINYDDKVTIYSVTGTLICKDKKWADAADRLENGFYIINGQKVIIRR